MDPQNRLRCYVCDHAFRPQLMSRMIGDANRAKREVAFSRREDARLPRQEVEIDSRLCLNCNRLINEELRRIEEDPASVPIRVLTQSSSRTCLICNDAAAIRRLSIECRVHIFIESGIYVPDYVKCCDAHLNEEQHLSRDVIGNLRAVRRRYILKGEDIFLFLQQLRDRVRENENFNIPDETRFSEEDFKTFSPISKEQFNDLFRLCDPIVDDGNKVRHVSKKDLLAFLCKLRHGLSDEFIKVVFGYSSRQCTSLAIAVVRKSLMQRFVPENLGLQAITRDDYIERHVTAFANALYNDQPEIPKAIVCIDGTYSNVEKSRNFRVLRQSFSAHKRRHLLKPALLVAPDGYILDIHGPYFSDSRNNDARILENELEKNEEALKEWFEAGDIIIVDRGYRDVVPVLEEIELQTEMPVCLLPGQRQLTTEQANNSRKVTKQRWIVESRNGHLQTIFRFFAHTTSITHAKNLGDFYRITGAIINKYRPPIIMNANAEDAFRMRERAREVNVVQARVEEERLHARNGRWRRLDEDVLQGFPILTIDQLKDLTVGVYQIELAPSYIQDKLLRSEDLIFEFDELIDEPGLLRVRMFSRFRNATSYQLWVSYSENEDADRESPILGYYCTCKSGARTLGTCAHVASVLWYLGYARHEENVKYPQTVLINMIMDAAQLPMQEVLF